MTSAQQSLVLTALAVGDSLGMPFETWPADHPKLLAWTGGYGRSEHHNLNPGQYTDDTQMARALAESLIACRGFNGRDVMDRYLALFETGIRGIGTATRRALTRYKANPGKPAGQRGTLGNGPVMRCAPIGVAFRNDPGMARRIAQEEALLTHDNLNVAQAAGAIAAMVAWLLTVSDRDPRSALRIASSFTLDCTQNTPFAEGLRVALCDIRSPHIQGGAVHTAVVAIACLIRSTSHRDAVETAIRLGGDTDTNGAVAGALAGACYGEVDADLIEGLEDHDAILELDRKLFDMELS